jgi:hypothetical protein
MMRDGAVPIAALILAGCDPGSSSAPAGVDASACEILFGRPDDKTGLDESQCRPSCHCGAIDWTAPSYDAAFLQSLLNDWQIAAPYSEIPVDPYTLPAPAPGLPERVCGLVPKGGGKPTQYDLVTYESEAIARAAGAKPTHFGGCGVCSTLPNLVVYMKYNDLTGPVRQCTLDGIGKTADVTITCLQALGFDLPCAQIWYFNGKNTQKYCMETCMTELNNPYHRPDGALNPCLQCDEEQSGAVFKAVAGRTRRNSGLANAMCRPCSEVRPLEHAY